MASIHAEMHASMRLPDLRVRWRSGMTPDFELQDSNIRGFVGVRADHSAGHLEAHDDESTKPWRKEYVQAISEGHLWACDEKTAREAAKFARTLDWKQFLAPPSESPAPAAE